MNIKYYGRLIKAYYKNHRLGLSIIVVAAILFLLLSLLIVGDTTSVPIWKRASMGLLFPLIIAVITMSGFLISLSKLEELLGRITSLSQFLEISVPILEKAVNKNEEIWIVCHYPYIGSLSARGTKGQEGFKNALDSLLATHRAKLNIVGICPSRLKEYFNYFNGDPRYEDVDCDAAFNELHKVFHLCLSKYDPANYYALQYQPPFFLVASRNEAAIASPIYLPGPSLKAEADYQSIGDSLDLKCSHACADFPHEISDAIIAKSKLGEKRVEFVGFYTQDTNQVNELLEAAEYLMKLSCKLDERYNIHNVFP